MTLLGRSCRRLTEGRIEYLHNPYLQRKRNRLVSNEFLQREPNAFCAAQHLKTPRGQLNVIGSAVEMVLCAARGRCLGQWGIAGRVSGEVCHGMPLLGEIVDATRRGVAAIGAVRAQVLRPSPCKATRLKGRTREQQSDLDQRHPVGGEVRFRTTLEIAR